MLVVLHQMGLIRTKFSKNVCSSNPLKSLSNTVSNATLQSNPQKNVNQWVKKAPPKVVMLTQTLRIYKWENTFA